MLTEQEKAELNLLNLANENHKFALEMKAYLGPLAAAFEHGLNNDYFRLLDVCPVPTGTGHMGAVRIFRLTNQGVFRKTMLKQKEKDDAETKEENPPGTVAGGGDSVNPDGGGDRRGGEGDGVQPSTNQDREGGGA